MFICQCQAIKWKFITATSGTEGKARIILLRIFMGIYSGNCFPKHFRPLLNYYYIVEIGL